MRVLVVEESAEQGEVALREAIEELGPDFVVIKAEALKELVDALATANLRLEERKLVERAKGLLMKARGLDEDAAYRALRSMAMEQNRRIGEVARSILGMAHLLR